MVDVVRISTTIASRCNLVPFFVKLIPEIIRLGLGHWQNMQTWPPGTPDNHFFMDVWWKHHFLCSDLESSSWNNHKKKRLFGVPGITSKRTFIGFGSTRPIWAIWKPKCPQSEKDALHGKCSIGQVCRNFFLGKSWFFAPGVLTLRWKWADGEIKLKLRWRCIQGLFDRREHYWWHLH